MQMTVTDGLLPTDAEDAALVGRIWRPDVEGPSVVKVSDGALVDITPSFPTVRDVCETPGPAAAVRAAEGESVGTVGEIAANTPPATRDPARPWLLAPIDLQAVKAAGVTFALSMLERVIEERAEGNPDAATAIREEVRAIIGDDLGALVPGSEEARRLKQALERQGAWSQYLEVGIGPDAEIFTKCQPMAAVGTGADVGIHPMSSWSNPEPEVVLAVSSRGEIVGATLGNDANLRDVEGRSALLLSMAKDNNASCAVGPLLRLCDGAFDLDRIRQTVVGLSIEGEDGFALQDSCALGEISRDPADLVAALIGPHHRYPDGAVLFLGTPFSPGKDRDAPGLGFTHKTGDVVRISAPGLGSLVNRVADTNRTEPWTFGASHLMRNLANRGLL